MNIPDLAIIILAAGKGTRMKSSKHKVLHNLGGKSMLQHLMDKTALLKPLTKIIVVGAQKDQVEIAVNGQADIIMQEPQLGTGHAVNITKEKLCDFKGNVLILFGDVPLLSQVTMQKMVDNLNQTDADIVVLLVEAHRGISSGVQSIIDQLKELEGRRVILAINKIDRVKSDALLALTQQLNAAFAFEKTFMISAERGHGVPDLRAWLGQELPEGPWLYPEDQIADLPLRMIAAEMTREKLTLRLHQELPYQLTVETESWEERPDGSARVDQVIYVVRDGHKGILLGNKGETIKAVSKAAREELEGFLERRVHLFCKVKVRQKWLEDAARYSEMGLDFRDGNG